MRLMSHAKAYWKSTIIQKLEERAPRATCETIRGANITEKRASGGAKNGDTVPAKEEYTAGIPISGGEIRATRTFRPSNGAGLISSGISLRENVAKQLMASFRDVSMRWRTHRGGTR